MAGPAVQVITADALPASPRLIAQNLELSHVKEIKRLFLTAIGAGR